MGPYPGFLSCKAAHGMCRCVICPSLPPNGNCKDKFTNPGSCSCCGDVLSLLRNLVFPHHLHMVTDLIATLQVEKNSIPLSVGDSHCFSWQTCFFVFPLLMSYSTIHTTKKTFSLIAKNSNQSTV